jgi:hypothetical protein
MIGNEHTASTKIGEEERSERKMGERIVTNIIE